MIINMLVNKTFKNKFILIDIIISALVASILYTFKDFIESIYDNRDFKNLLINHNVAISSLKDIEQYTILKRLISNLELNKNDVSKFKFDIDSNFSIDLISLNILINRIKFHIIFANISFLLYLVDLNRFDIYFNYLINMFIKNRYNIDLQIDMKKSHQADIF